MTKLLQVLFSSVCHQELQSEIDHLIEWSDKWESKFDTSKCKVNTLDQLIQAHIQCWT